MNTQLKKGLIPGMIFLCASAFAQSNQLPETSSYIRLMLNMVTTTTDGGHGNSGLWDPKASSRGLQGGTSVQLGITPRFSLLSEFYYLAKGGPVKTSDLQGGGKATIRFHTLELPALARVHLGRFHLNAGPSIAYNLSGKLKFEDHSTKLSFNRSSEGFRRWDAGVQVGGGFRFKIKQKNLVFDARYSHGLTSISRGEDMYNRFLNISLQIINPWKINPLGRKNG